MNSEKVIRALKDLDLCELESDKFNRNEIREALLIAIWAVKSVHILREEIKLRRSAGSYEIEFPEVLNIIGDEEQ